MLRWVCVVSCVLAAGGCGGLATDVLNHGCEDAADCVVVDGDPCDACACVSDAINVGAVGAYEALRAEFVCGPVVDDDCDCPTFVAVCVEGRCEAVQGAGISGEAKRLPH